MLSSELNSVQTNRFASVCRKLSECVQLYKSRCTMYNCRGSCVQLCASLNSISHRFLADWQPLLSSRCSCLSSPLSQFAQSSLAPQSSRCALARLWGELHVHTLDLRASEWGVSKTNGRVFIRSRLFIKTLDEPAAGLVPSPPRAQQCCYASRFLGMPWRLP